MSSQNDLSLVPELAAENVPVAKTYRVLGFSMLAYCAWRQQSMSQRDWDDAHLIDAAVDIHADDPAFGYRSVADEPHKCGLAVGESWVARLCSQQRIWSVFVKKHGLIRKAGPPVCDDLVDRKFTATPPNDTWPTDITEHNTIPGGGGAAQRDHPAQPGGHDGALRPRQPIPLERLRPHDQE